MRQSWFGRKKRSVGEVDWARHVRDDTDLADRTLFVVIAINVLVWAVWRFAIQDDANYLFQVLMSEHFVVSGRALESFRIWTLLTSVFSHYDFGHLLFNMFALFVFGRTVGRALGTVTLLQLYVVGGVAASLAHVGYNYLTGDPVGALGASGAVMAISVVYAAMFPNQTLLVGFFLPMPAWLAVGAFIALDVVGTFSPTSSVAHAAHLGGAAYGFLYWYLRVRPPSRPRFKKGTYGTRL